MNKGGRDVALDERRLTELEEAAAELAAVVSTSADALARDVQGVADHLAERRFDVTVVGEFNRGKSTLLNRLIERDILPAGVLPVTSIVTELVYSDDEAATVTYEDGTEDVIDLTTLDDYVTEQENPGNARKITRARIKLNAPFLQHGAVLVDTPGVGSIFRQSTETAREAILRADGAIMVMSADAPITDAERNLIKLLSQRSERTFFVLNRIDHIESPDELDDIAWFVESVLREAFGIDQKVYRLSAKTGVGLDEFVRDVEDFLANGLSAARVALARKDVLALADRIDNECDLEDSAMALNATEVDERLSQFRRASDWQHDAFRDDQVLFEHASARIAGEMRDRMISASVVTDEAIADLHEAVTESSRAELEIAMDKAIEKRVRALMEPIRRREELDMERLWRRAAERFERATQRRADKLRDLAGELFDVQLRPIQVTQPSAQRARFFYSPPVRQAEPTGMLSRLLRPLLPERRNRDRLLEAGDQRFRQEMARHAERLGDDLAQRLGDANHQLLEAMDEQVMQVSHAMLRVIERAHAAKTATEFSQREQRDRSRRLRDAAEKARRAATLHQV